jgi:hypothetical protein
MMDPPARVTVLIADIEFDELDHALALECSSLMSWVGEPLVLLDVASRFHGHCA